MIAAMLLLAATFAAPAAPPDRWPGLATLRIATSCADEPIEIRYDPKLAVVDNVPVEDPDTGAKSVHALRVKTAPDSPQYAVDWHEGMSCDPTFLFWSSPADRAEGKPLLDAFGLVLAIPGDGFVYASGHTNAYYDQVRKYVAAPDGFAEVPQPFYHVGRATKALVPVDVLVAPDAKTTVAVLLPGDAATIDVCRADDWCIVADARGLAGWVKLEYLENGQFDGIHFAGD